MASLQQLDLMANNKNASDSSEDDNTSSEDEASAKVEGQFDDARSVDDETNDDDDDNGDDGDSSDSNVAAGMAVDSPHSESKPRIKLRIRSSLASSGSRAKPLPLRGQSERDGVNGTKHEDFTNNGCDENKKPPPTLHLVRPAAAASVPANVSTGTSASRINIQTKPVAAVNSTLPVAVKQDFVEESTPSVAGKQEVERQKTSVAIKQEHEVEPVAKKQKIISNPNGSKPYAAAAPVIASKREISEDSNASAAGVAAVVGLAKPDPSTAAVLQTKPPVTGETQKNRTSTTDAQNTTALKIKSEPATVAQGQPMTEFKINPETVATANGAFKVPSASSGAKADPNKKKLTKRKLPGLPLSMKRKLPLKGDKGDSTGDTVVKAQVVDKNDNSEEDVVATVVEEVPSSVAVAPAKGKTSKSQAALSAGLTKRKPQGHARPLRMPPMTSPGLLIPKSQAGMYRSDVDANGFVTPATIFEQSMAAAGYTYENRTKHPHRGSSVKRVVADMFDSNVAFTLYFPHLVPKYLWYEQPEQPEEQGKENDKEDSDKKDGEKLDCETTVDEKNDGDNTVGEKKDSDSTVGEKKDGDTTGDKKEDLSVSDTSSTVISQPKTPLPHLLMKSLEKDLKKSNKHGLDQASMNGRENGLRKRRRPLQFSDMIPTSLTLPYPESYLDKRMEYVKEVQEREKAIVAYQEMQLRLEFEQEENGNSNEDESPKIANPVKVPPIPTPPAPPRLSEFKGIDPQLYEDRHPIYLPRGKQNFVAHLDKNCFHITEGCYFGLSSNFIADPHYVGPNAPGITAANIACGSGLATQSTSTGSTGHAGGAVLALAPSNIPPDFDLGNPVLPPAPKKKNLSGPKPPKKSSAPPPTVSKPAPKNKVKVKHVGPTPTANASDLRKIMEAGGDLAAEMRKCIIRGAVHASRSGKHVQSFLAPDGKAYPDVSKSFAAHAGLKPCQRCKNNKQGAYHCRLRRKHKEPDFDGGNSFEELGPFLAETKDAK